MTTDTLLGTEGEYDWLVTDKDFDLVQLCPQIVLGKYIAITSTDSGALFVRHRDASTAFVTLPVSYAFIALKT